MRISVKRKNGKAYSRIINNLEKQSGKLLDYGCGPGILANKLQKRGFSVIGVDISRKMVEQANKSYGEFIVFKQSSLQGMLPDEESFDVIVLAEVIQYLNHRKAIEVLMKKTKQGGQIIITGPNYDFFHYQNKQRTVVCKIKDLIISFRTFITSGSFSNYKPIKLPNFIKMIEKTNQCQSITIDCSSVIDNQYNNFVISIIKK